MKLKDLKKGTFFTKKFIEYPDEYQVFIKGYYDRHLKRYECTRFADCNNVQYINGNKEVFTDFIF